MRCVSSERASFNSSRQEMANVTEVSFKDVLTFSVSFCVFSMLIGTVPERWSCLALFWFAVFRTFA